MFEWGRQTTRMELSSEQIFSQIGNKAARDCLEKQGNSNLTASLLLHLLKSKQIILGCNLSV